MSKNTTKSSIRVKMGTTVIEIMSEYQRIIGFYIFKAEQEANKEVIDLTDEADDKIEEHEEKEEVLNTESSDTAPMGTTEQNKEEDYTVIPDAIEEE